VSLIGNGPVTASRLSTTWLRLTGKDRWLPATATVHTCEWSDLPDQVNSEVGHYHVVYSYVADGERYTGKFADYGNQHESHLDPGDTFTIRFNPRHPSRSYYPDRRTRHAFVLICLLIGAGLAFLVCGLRWLR
jgi:hypothetical protein